MAIPILTVVEDYEAFEILTEQQLNDSMISIQNHINTNVKLNFEQIAKDVFGNSYDYNNDGIATLGTPFFDQAPLKTGSQTIQGAWTFQNNVTIQEVLSTQKKVDLTGQYKNKNFVATADFSVADDTLTAVLFNAESYDTGDLHSLIGSTERITIPADGTGLYLFDIQVTFDNNATGRREVWLYKNNNPISQIEELAPNAARVTVLHLTAHDLASGNDFYDVRVYQNSTGALDVNNGERVT